MIKMKTKTKAILAFEALLVIGILSYLVLSKPVAIAPLSGNVIMENNFDFKFENAKKVIISRDKNFDNKIEFNKDFAINLPPGTYYWKLKGWVRETEVMNFTLQSRLSLRLEE